MISSIGNTAKRAVASLFFYTGASNVLIGNFLMTEERSFKTIKRGWRNERFGKGINGNSLPVMAGSLRPFRN
jgi:hypothetical protein